MLPESLKAMVLSLYPVETQVLEGIAYGLKRIDLKKKDLLFKQSHVCKNLYFLEKGLLRSFYTEEEKEATTWFMKENDFVISVKSFFDQVPGNESIEAIEDCILYYISHEYLMHLYQQFHSFTIVGLLITQHYYKQSEERLFNLRKKDAYDRYQYLLQTNPDVALRCPLKHIASYLGITIETLSRIRGRRI